MGRKQAYNRLHDDWPYFRADGFPDLVYDTSTSVYRCMYCDGKKCAKCFASGYLFLDSEKFHNLILEAFLERTTESNGCQYYPTEQ
jgi:hypothetical protein